MNRATPPATAGLLEALRAAGTTLNELVRVRGALFSVELREEVLRRKEMLVLAAVGFAFLHTAFLLFTFLLAAAFWDSYRYAALGAMTALYAACGSAIFWRLRMASQAKPAPFAATLAELDRDLDGLRGRR